MRLLLLGCTGFIGRELVPRLLEDGHTGILVSRKEAPGFASKENSDKLVNLRIDPSKPINWEKDSLLRGLEESDGVINLVGEPIAEKRWTPSHCRELFGSRIETTRSLVEAMAKVKSIPKVLVNASAVGYYGTSLESKFTESSPPGDDFLGRLCVGWEDAASLKPRRTRLVIPRLGIVLGADGGALAKMLPVFRAGFGGPIGTGLQWMSWIHRTDLCELISQALVKRSWKGVINAVAPETVSMSTFASTLGQSLGRPAILPVPSPILKLLLGDGAKVVLEGQNVVSERLEKLGFRFEFPSLKEAICSDFSH
ncbi:TIGR01777 family oxidoreductase [Prochlorococcus sp. MIT 1341]|uniref:TIGR01777 family oxidoreductase n=1 Tax=Prochlorococcus sp. MIT 1341 TaxID=3096221 RepID=UPI002A74CDDE|nr:TIGR01777 family oxidoreductase [Prochlorococcus sp. MIT 1341]